MTTLLTMVVVVVAVDPMWRRRRGDRGRMRCTAACGVAVQWRMLRVRLTCLMMMMVVVVVVVTMTWGRRGDLEHAGTARV